MGKHGENMVKAFSLVRWMLTSDHEKGLYTETQKADESTATIGKSAANRVGGGRISCSGTRGQCKHILP